LTNRLIAALLGACFAAPALAAPSVTPSGTPAAKLTVLPAAVGGRVAGADGGFTYQWPGTYFETAFSGRSAYFTLGPGNVIAHVSVDGKRVARLVKPQGGYRVDGLGEGAHLLRIDIATESQAGPNQFKGFALLDPAGRALPLPKRARQIEFLGDSHTVGYGNVSASRDCTEAQVWETTDNTQGIGAVTAKTYDADYRINAISGRGIVRNFNGGKGDTLPQAYPHALFDHSAPAADERWRPQVIVIALGTNDFSTPLNPGEPWKTREALHADFEATYVNFVKQLRGRHPHAQVVLWATDGANGEIASEVGKVHAQLKASGDTRVSFMPVSALEMKGCHWHPSTADDGRISQQLVKLIDAVPGVWERRPMP
jgi:lysophospholipase L1-like esterase